MNQDFIEKLPTECTKAVFYIIDAYNEYSNFTSDFDLDIPLRDVFSESVEYYYLLNAYLNSKGYFYDELMFTENLRANLDAIKLFFTQISKEFNKIATNDSISQARDKFNTIFSNSFSYEFTTGDLNRIQTLINELRSSIGVSDLFTAEHKQRLLKRLEKIQSELHKKISDVDRFWGLIGDAGVVIGKFGNDAKPFVDRIKEIADIVWRTQSRSEELPSGTTIPFLTQKDDTQRT